MYLLIYYIIIINRIINFYNFVIGQFIIHINKLFILLIVIHTIWKTFERHIEKKITNCCTINIILINKNIILKLFGV